MVYAKKSMSVEKPIQFCDSPPPSCLFRESLPHILLHYLEVLMAGNGDLITYLKSPRPLNIN